MKIFIPRVTIKNVSLDFLIAFPETLARNSFLVSMGLISLALIIGGIFYARIDFLIRFQPQESGQSFHFKTETYGQVLHILENRAEEFRSAAEKEYPDSFSPLEP